MQRHYANPKLSTRSHLQGFRVLLKVSTAHLTPETVRAAEGWTSISAPVVWFAGYECGFFCATHPKRPPKAPPDLDAVLAFARRNGADFVLFDSDADRHPELPDYSREPGHPHPPYLSEAQLEAIAQDAAAVRNG